MGKTVAYISNTFDRISLKLYEVIGALAAITLQDNLDKIMLNLISPLR